MQKIGSNVRIWLALWLAIALPLGGRAFEMRSTCHMACAKGTKTCHSCCGDKAGCHLATGTALPVSDSTLKLVRQHDSFLLHALPATMSPLTILPDQAPVIKLVRDLGPPPRDLLAKDCVLLI
jgi:hypothetical protein